MTIFSYHLLEVSMLDAMKGLISAPITKKTPGLIHAEYMTVMALGSDVFSSKRMLLGQVAIFAQWDSEQALNYLIQKDQKQVQQAGRSKIGF